MRRTLYAILATLVLVPAILLSFAGPAAARDRLVIGMSQFPATLNPNIDTMLAKSYVLALAMRPVTAYDQSWELTCLLCTELPTLENGLAEKIPLEAGRDGVVVTYRIHDQATWGDGTPVTSADMVFTWEVGRDPESGVAGQEAYRRITEVEVVDPKTFRLHVDRLTYTYNSLGIELLPAHLERAAFEADPARYRLTTLYDTDPANPGLWFGPYRVTEVAPGSHIVLKRNPTWFGAPPAFEEIVVKTIENTAALEANLLSGGIDMIAGELGLTIDQALAFEKRHGDRYQILYKPGLIYEHIDLNLDNPFLADVRVRRALMHAIDRQAMSEQLFEGRQPPAESFVNPLDGIHSDDVAKYPFDPEAAKALLEEAGWTPGPGGVRVNDKGERLALTIMTTAGSKTRELVEQAIQAMLAGVGIELSIENEPPRVFFGETVRKRRFPHMAMFAWLSAPEHVPRSTLHSEEIPTEENGWSGQNYTGFRNAEMDRLIDTIELGTG